LLFQKDAGKLRADIGFDGSGKNLKSERNFNCYPKKDLINSLVRKGKTLCCCCLSDAREREKERSEKLDNKSNWRRRRREKTYIVHENSIFR
jgi:hypothetical protein